MSKVVRRPLALMVISGDVERLHMALMTAAAAASTGRKVMVFVAKSALPAFRKGGWDALGGAAYDARLLDRGVADFSVLLDAVKALNVEFALCDQAMMEHAVDAADVDARVRPNIAGLANVLDRYSDAQWMTF